MIIPPSLPFKSYLILNAIKIRNIVISTFLGSIYYRLPVGSDSSAYTNRMGLFFFVLLSNFVGHQEVIPIMFHNRLLFYRERGNST